MTMIAMLFMFALADGMTITEALLAAVGTETAVIGVLFGYLRSVDARQQKKLDDCEADRRELWKALLPFGITPPEKTDRFHQ
jgi:hypothetical protein